MMNNVIAVLALGYGSVSLYILSKNQRYREGIVMFLLCTVAALYCETWFGSRIPTIESFQRMVYSSLSGYVLKQLGIGWES
ncbi:hypothetical protein ABE504_06530 [Paenibacillus oryzisoli]|uniref:hypothetical protein n=1 Tax=Paenibacillus oryzisoli TaxID=1850517 RepID=UPI003D2845F6